MSDDAAGFVGSVPENYDRGLGPIIFTDYDEHTARLVAGYAFRCTNAAAAAFGGWDHSSASGVIAGSAAFCQASL